ncbi:MAG: hypothetical protein ACAF41_29900 [Leptolyngbya sp. BL-A-14]
MPFITFCSVKRKKTFNKGIATSIVFRVMTIAIALIALGVLTQAVVLATSNGELPRFNKMCQTCGYQIPPMERPPAFHDCPECEKLFSLSDRLVQR